MNGVAKTAQNLSSYYKIEEEDSCLSRQPVNLMSFANLTIHYFTFRITHRWTSSVLKDVAKTTSISSSDCKIETTWLDKNRQLHGCVERSACR